MKQKISVYDLIPLLKDKRTASSLQYLMNLHPKKKAQEISHKIKLIRSASKFYSNLKTLAK